MRVNAVAADRVVQRLWDRDVRAWEKHWVPVFRKFAIDLVTDAGIGRGDVVLDIGTGTGVAAFEAAKAAVRGFVVGIDRSKTMLEAAKAKASRAAVDNIRFLRMDGSKILFPDGFFDAVISNCGISFVSFDSVAREAFRATRTGGSFVYNVWRLQDVAVHKTFAEVMKRHRTPNPSTGLLTERDALAKLESYVIHKMGHDAQFKALKMVGFSEPRIKNRAYRIRLDGVSDYLEARFSRSTLKRELNEMPKRERTLLYHELTTSLTPFVRKGSFIFDWKVSFIIAKKLYD